MSDLRSLLDGVEGFEWDAGNALKNELGHGVSRDEAEEIFFFAPGMPFEDERHSQTEQRYHVCGRTAGGRKLTVVFTIREKRLRVISARDMSRRERILYEEAHSEEAQTHPGVRDGRRGG